jgi:polyhydroxyalkanoate synthesis regulator phasin
MIMERGEGDIPEGGINMKHNYIDALKEELNEKMQEVIDLANDDLEYYFEYKDDEDYSFSEEMIQESEALGKEYKFDDVEEAFSFLRIAEYMSDYQYPSEEDLWELRDKISDAEHQLKEIKAYIEDFKKEISNIEISTSRKSISTYLYFDATEHNYNVMLENVDDENFYEDYAGFNDYAENYGTHDKLCVRISDHDVGYHFVEGLGDCRYDNDCALINI